MVHITVHYRLRLSYFETYFTHKNLHLNCFAGLKDLMLAGCSWSSISALSSSTCPLLRSLDLRYADGVKDAQIRDLVTPPGEESLSS